MAIPPDNDFEKSYQKEMDWTKISVNERGTQSPHQQVNPTTLIYQNTQQPSQAAGFPTAAAGRG